VRILERLDRDGQVLGRPERLELVDGCPCERREPDDVAPSRGLARFVARDEDERLRESLQFVIREHGALEDRAKRCGQVAVGSAEGLTHRQTRGRERRAQVVRERVDEIADHVASFEQRRVRSGEVGVALGELREERRLRERDAGLVDVVAHAFPEAGLERSRAASEDQDAEDRLVFDDGHGDRIRDGEFVEHEPADGTRGTGVRGLAALRQARDERQQADRGPDVGRFDVAAAEAPEGRGFVEALFEREQEREIEVERVDRLADHRAFDELTVDGLTDRLDRSTHRPFARRALAARLEGAGAARGALGCHAEAADEQERKGGDHAVAEGDRVPVVRLRAVRIAGRDVGRDGEPDEPRRKARIERETREGDRAVHQDGDDKELRGRKIEHPGGDDQQETGGSHEALGHLSGFAAGSMPSARPIRSTVDVESRPSPESLLKEFGSSPKLTVYLASAPGAGKTRRLLEDALRLQEAGRRVAIGWVETKDRPDLAALVKRLPQIPPRSVRVGDATFAEFDLAAALERRPEHLVLDEVAHTNLPGGPNEKRWQDALALRAAGIGVGSAMNIQHLESVAAAAERLIGFPVREIVPVSFLREADQVIALDVSPEQFEARLRAGAIVRSDDVDRALASNVFRPQNLRYLREMMLRVVDDLTIPEISPRQVSTALALATRSVDVAVFARMAAAVARALDLALEVAYFGPRDPVALADIARENDARIVALEDFDAQRPQLRQLKAALVAVPFGTLATRIASEPLDRDLLVLDPERVRRLDDDRSIEGVPYGQTAGDRLKIGYGRLTIYLGAAAGSGKTYAMLDRAHQLAEEGVDVVGAFVEPHARPETRAKMTGIDILPRRTVVLDGVTSTELDLATLLERKPKIALIDELAHTNPASDAHAKRYDDVLQVLRAGISVMTTLNVQHLEGLGDAVYRLTKQRVRETVPDAILELADDLILIDATPETLRERLRAGKIYPADRIEPALANFFRTENLAALRELALREVARARAPLRLPVPFGRLAIGVKARERDAALIERAARFAMRLEIDLSVVHVHRGGGAPSRVVDALESAARRVRARWRVASGDDVAAALIEAAAAEDAGAIAIEGARGRSRWPRSDVPFAKKLLEAGARQVLVLAPITE